MSRLIKYILYSLFLPIWWLQLLIPRNKNIWVFGAWYGKRYSDNSKHLFEYVGKTNPGIKTIWITKNKVVKDYLIRQGQISYMAYSLQGAYYCLRAKYVFVSSVKKDVNELFINGAKTIQLWHGNPIKKIGLDDQYSLSRSFFYQSLVRKIFPMAYEFNYDHVVSSAPSSTKNLASAFDLPENRILETGCPRNDVFFSEEIAPINKKIKKKHFGCKIIYYLPTFRSAKKPQSLLDLEDYNENVLQKFLETENLVFVTKGHFTVKPHNKYDIENDRIYHIPDEALVDINFLLKDADILITDYSSVYFDFLLLQRPIIFAAFDLEDYISESREMYFDYKNIVAGPIAKSWPQLFNEIKNSQNELKYNLALKKYNSIFNKYHDGNSSKRLYDFTMELENGKSV